MEKKILNMSDNIAQIDDSYFSDYGGGAYSDTYSKYTYHPQTILMNLISEKIPVDTILDAGCASGELVKDLRNLGVKSYGIENNREILKKSVIPKFCLYMDLNDLSSIKDKSFSVVYSNACMYLRPQNIVKVLKEFNRICSHAVFLCNPMLGESDPLDDLYRAFLASPEWWAEKFKEAGFKKLTKEIYVKESSY